MGALGIGGLNGRGLRGPRVLVVGLGWERWVREGIEGGREELEGGNGGGVDVKI